jgi:hypothetical protein
MNSTHLIARLAQAFVAVAMTVTTLLVFPW